MGKSDKNIFVIMPFAAELHYFFLYLKKHIEDKHLVKCARADDRILTKPLLEKINDYILNADLIIADCTGRNPNVFYELGMAHAHGKKVVLITKDDIKDTPSDIRHYEFIKYDLGDHTGFFYKLDNALLNIFEKDYESLYEEAHGIFKTFLKETGASVEPAPLEIFVSRVKAGESSAGIPPPENEWAHKAFLLPRIVKDSNDFAVMKTITDWLSSNGDS